LPLNEIPAAIHQGISQIRQQGCGVESQP